MVGQEPVDCSAACGCSFWSLGSDIGIKPLKFPPRADGASERFCGQKVQAARGVTAKWSNSMLDLWCRVFLE